MEPCPFFRQIKSPVTESQLSPLDPQCRVVQFSEPLTEGDLAKLAEFMQHYPEISLRIFGHYGIPTNLDFLRHFPYLKGFQADIWEMMDYDGLNYLSNDLQVLGFGRTRRRYSLNFLQQFPNLQELYLEGDVKGFEQVGGLTKLTQFTMRSITLPDLSVLTALPNLWSLDIKLGGTKDLSLLPKIGRLEYLELWMVKGMCNLEPISEVATLQNLFIQSLRQVTVLPSFVNLMRLRRVMLCTMKGLRELSPLTEAKSLEELCVYDASNMLPSDFECLVGHSSLKRVSAGLGSVKKNRAVKAILGPLAFNQGLKPFVYD